MDILNAFISFMRDPREWLTGLLSLYGGWVYGLLFLVIFCETGLVVTPFLPGESLLFAAGAVVGGTGGQLDPWLLFAALTIAAIAGDTVNYWIGNKLGCRMLSNPNSKILKREHVERTQAFFAKYGGKTIILGRFVPFVRTFAPFLAGAGTMEYGRFLLFNVVGGTLWVAIAFGAGYFFGSVPIVESNLTLVLVGVVLVSLTPPVVEYITHKRKAALETTASSHRDERS